MVGNAFSKITLLLITVAAGVVILVVIFTGRQGNVNVEPEILPEKIVFNSKVYIPAKCILDSSINATRMGVSDQGMAVYISETDEIPVGVGNERGILIKRSDGKYQCYMFSLF